MAWRLAKSLETLRSQINDAYPNRNKASDGTIGDAAHAASASDHNPNRNNVVCALDLTHDPKNGFDAHKFAEYLRTHRHPNLRYIISNARIAGWWNNWTWGPSVGHTQHVHISVGTLGVGDGQTYDRYDSTQKWDINYKGVKKKMVTQDQLNVLFRLYRGDSPTAAQSKKYVGKHSWEYMQKLLRSPNSNMKLLIPKAKNGTLNLQNFLPSELRRVYVAPKPVSTAKVDKAVVLDYINKNTK